MDKLNEFLRELEASFEDAESGALKADTQFRDLAWWDSLAALTTLAVVDSCYGRQLSATDLAKCHTFEDIHAMVSE